MKKRIISILLVMMMVISLVACGNEKTPVNNDQSSQVDPVKDNDTNEPKEDDKEKVSSTQVGNIVERSKGVTYRLHTSSTPVTMNSHDTTTADANFITNRTTVGFYEFKATDTKDAYEFICEMAAEFPIDITNKYAGDATYGVPADATEHYAYLIKLNKDAKWEDGTPITADDYLYSYFALLDPAMKNVRASELYQGNFNIANAENYYKQGIAYEDVVNNDKTADVPESEYVISVTDPIFFFGGESMKQYYDDGYQDYFVSEDGRDLYKLYSEQKYYPLDDQVKKDMTELALSFGDSNPEAYKEFCLAAVEYPEISKDAVGIKKVNDYELEFILKAPTDDFFITYSLGSNWLVNKDLYENNKKDMGGITKTTYGNDMESYMSYGPYKITEYIKDKLVVLSMNENWYGWTDGRHEYYSNYEKVRYDVIPEYETAFQMFLQGKLDNIGIISGKDDYAVSDYVFSEPDIYTWNINFHVNRANLKSFETPGINKSMLSYKDFRQAISLGINRTNFAKALGPLDKPANTMLNETYIADPEEGMAYRDTEYGKQVEIDLYGGVGVDAGYDVAKARELAIKAYEEAKANGDYIDGDVITLSYPRAKESDFAKLLMTTVESSVLEVLKGTPLEGKFKVELLITEEWSKKMETGEAQLVLSGGGGGAFDPFGLLEFNLNPGKTYGIDYSKIDLTLNIDGQDITKSIYGWADAIYSGEYRQADMDTKCYILSKTEAAALKEFASIPVESSSTDSLLSMRRSKELDHYIPMLGFGRDYFAMTDAEWDAFVQENGGELDYK